MHLLISIISMLVGRNREKLLEKNLKSQRQSGIKYISNIYYIYSLKTLKTLLYLGYKENTCGCTTFLQIKNGKHFNTANAYSIQIFLSNENNNKKKKEKRNQKMKIQIPLLKAGLQSIIDTFDKNY